MTHRGGAGGGPMRQKEIELRSVAERMTPHEEFMTEAPRALGGGGVLSLDLTRPVSTLTDTRPSCFEVEKHALRLGASAHYLPTNHPGPSPLRPGFP